MSSTKLTIIVAASENRAIGRKNQMPWHLPNDFKYFKKQTMDHSIVMGRKTFDSIGSPLPGRRNIVISRDEGLIREGVDVANSLEEVLTYCRDEREIFILGGAQIYSQAMDLVDRILLTKVHTNIEDADAFFPELSPDHWELISSVTHNKDEKHAYDYTFQEYIRK